MKDSSFIKDIRWTDSSLFVTIKPQKVYEYANVPESLYQDFLKADSLGKFYAEHIKGKYQINDVPVEDKNLPWPFPTSLKP